MKINFSKYQGTGNDFIIIDNRNNQVQLNNEHIVFLCHRRYGIGSDGLILIQNHSELDFEMVFYNPDSSQSFCGNGSRCAVVFANSLNLFDQKTEFLSTDGVHEAELMNDSWVSLKMHDVSEHEKINADLFIDTGSPHYLIQNNMENGFDLISEARKVRYNDRFMEKGVNVNFIRSEDDVIHLRTYERGVENETLSCGTGVTASALANHIYNGNLNGSFTQKVISQGGSLEVDFQSDGEQFTEIYLKGPAAFVYEGEIEI